jgi:hypothetical protein
MKYYSKNSLFFSFSWGTVVVSGSRACPLGSLGRGPLPVVKGYFHCLVYTELLCCQSPSLVADSKATGKRPIYYSFILLYKWLMKLTSTHHKPFKTDQSSIHLANIMEYPFCTGNFPRLWGWGYFSQTVNTSLEVSTSSRYARKMILPMPRAPKM